MSKKVLSQITRQLTPYIIWSNLLYTVGPMLSGWLLPHYQHEYLFYFPKNLFSYSVSFDAILFLQNNYEWEINYAFFPAYTYLLKVFEYVLSFVFTDTSVWVVVTAIVFNKILTALNAIMLTNLSLGFLNRKASLLVGIVFLFNPAGIFHHAVYSQPLFMFVTLLGFSCAFRENTDPANPLEYIQDNLISLVFFSISTTIRTTGMFYSLIFGVPILIRLFDTVKRHNWTSAFKVCLSGAMTLAFFTLPFMAYLWNGYHRFCNERIRSNFCDYRVPNLYSYLEDEFWSVGFLKYYYFGNIHSIVFGLTTVVVVAVVFRPSLYSTNQSRGLAGSMVCLAVVIVLFANVQPGTRFLSTHPAFYLNIADFLSKPKPTSTSLLQRGVILYLVVFNMFGLVFFPARFSWV